MVRLGSWVRLQSSQGVTVLGKARGVEDSTVHGKAGFLGKTIQSPQEQPATQSYKCMMGLFVFP